MAYKEKLNNRTRESISHLPKVEKQFMFGGTSFMLNGKMHVGVVKIK
jgi:TfoX/Sxy family transcriptional regulator of competence genes